MSFANKQLSIINKTFGGSIQNMTGNRIVRFSNRYGTGVVQGNELGDGITYLNYKMSTRTGYSLRLNGAENNILYFIYCSQGRMAISFSSTDKVTELGSLQTAILSSASSELSLEIEGEEMEFTLIRVIKSREKPVVATDLDLNDKIFKRFLNNGVELNYVGSSNLKIREQLKQISKINEKGLVRDLLIRGIISFVLALEILQFDLDKKKSRKVISLLRSSELRSVGEASQEILEAPEKPLTLGYLSAKYGLSPAKLQAGFKALHGTTVTRFIQSVRLETAERMIKNSDLNISEVVYSIGFTSRSYFSKIFKDRFNCSPRRYQERCHKDNHLKNVG